MRIRFSENIAIQLVLSLCARWLPSGNEALRSNTPMLSSPRNPPWKILLPSESFRLTHQVKARSSLWKIVSRNARSPSRLFTFDLEHAPGRPRQDGRIYITEVPFVGRNLAVGMLVPLANYNIELTFGKMRINYGQRDAMKGQVPRGVPGRFPSIGHRHDALVIKMLPIGITTAPARRWWRGISRITCKPFLHDVVVELFTPE